MKKIGITMGCPVGIGPEIILRYFSERLTPPDYDVFVIGDQAILERCSTELGLTARFSEFALNDVRPEPNTIPVLPVSRLNANDLCWGQPTPTTGAVMAEYIIRGIELALTDSIAAIVTCPISKASLNSAGYQYPGHTEMLAHLTRAKKHAMMLAGDKLRVTLVTIHNSLRDVPALLSIDKIADLVQLTNNSLRNDFGIATPRIAVAGLNPHGGEEGLFGDEEKTLITPAVAACRQLGVEVSGPYPPDTVFFKAAAGNFDTVVCMYHDQGLIPFKLLHFADGVNVTIGLPIVRTSVDHGTAYDIAGLGKASASSLKAAIETAATIAENREKSR